MKNFQEKYEFVDKYYNKTIDIKRAELAEGGYSNIYRIRDKKVKTEYVLKKLRKFDPKDNFFFEKLKEGFEDEIGILIKVKGKNIINIIDYYSDEKYYNIVLEKMDGDLDEMLTKYYKNGMPSKLIMKIFAQINSGLKKMLKNGKTHRDLKPSNILISYSNDNKTDFIIKLGGFGLSTDLGSTATIASDAGTELFKAPEVEEGRFSNKCDLYSLGIILYMLKTGQYIFEGNNYYEKWTNKKLNKKKKRNR